MQNCISKFLIFHFLCSEEKRHPHKKIQGDIFLPSSCLKSHSLCSRFIFYFSKISKSQHGTSGEIIEKEWKILKNFFKIIFVVYHFVTSLFRLLTIMACFILSRIYVHVYTLLYVTYSGFCKQINNSLHFFIIFLCS